MTLDQLQPIERIGRVAAPLLLVVGSRDPYTPLEDSRALLERAPAGTRFWASDGAKHEDFYAFAPWDTSATSAPSWRPTCAAHSTG